MSHQLAAKKQVLYHLPSLVPGLLPVEDEQKVLELGQTELLPLDLPGIVLLQHELLVVVGVLHPEHSQQQRLLILIESPQF